MSRKKQGKWQTNMGPDKFWIGGFLLVLGLITLWVRRDEQIDRYADHGYTYKKPTLTSPERQASYHLTTSHGWSNDLQTIYYDHRTRSYRIYFLHSSDGATKPFGPKGQNWTVTTTKDFIHFSKQQTAIKAAGPASPEAWKSAWTGAVIQNQGLINGAAKGAPVAYFSGLKRSDGSQNVWAAWSSDGGLTFSHPLNGGKPVLDHSWSFASQKADQERDPAVFYDHGKLIMYVAEGNQFGVYQSADGLHWTKADAKGASKVLGTSALTGFTDQDQPLECPVIRFMKNAQGQTKTVLFFGAKQPQNGQTTGTYATVGHLDQNGLFIPEGASQRLDQGSDFYGANFSGSTDSAVPDQTIYAMGWVGNWSYTASGVLSGQGQQAKKAQRLGSYSLARKLFLNGQQLIQTPVTGKLNEKQTQMAAGKFSNGNWQQLASQKHQAVNTHCQLKLTGFTGQVQLLLTQGSDQVKLQLNAATGTYQITRVAKELAGQAKADYQAPQNGQIQPSRQLTLNVYTDQNSVEIFFPGGQACTLARYSVSRQQDLTIKAQGQGKFTLKSSQAGADLPN
ncbi:MAG: GH32 C-terminal domain-containing protein [Lactobacillus equicursoris]|uniref:GH32 C-terminal domain-containing protein n=1 Tax=Lactobacillus equicursoris TaxID=420645 RepID=UPI00242C379D|nr:GH32 C-terminal domain-containing protein [Lactobacillus equicursoris]MDD6407126.1 GH32 C-terminal domain-containing protein [Lactobacillus equicursoris]